MLLPAPVELPCRPGPRLLTALRPCAAVADVSSASGSVGLTADYLHLLCGPIVAGTVQHCDRPMQAGRRSVAAWPATCTCSARSIKIEVNPGTPRARTVLDIPVWDFDNQGSRPIAPYHLKPADTVRVTCRHDQSLRDQLPSFEKQRADRYVVWGEGTTDEMCLGILLDHRPARPAASP